MPATIEGGDVLVIGNRALLIGMSERTTPQAVEVARRDRYLSGFRLRQGASRERLGGRLAAAAAPVLLSPGRARVYAETA
jgi:hypothetical protein